MQAIKPNFQLEPPVIFDRYRFVIIYLD